MEISWTVREYAADDLVLIDSWWKGHRSERFPSELLPPVGVIALADGEPVAACWLYMAVNVGVCWIEYPISKPGLGIKKSAAAFDVLVRILTEIAKTHDYHVMIANTMPGIARFLERNHGFTNRGQLTCLEKII